MPPPALHRLDGHWFCSNTMMYGAKGSSGRLWLWQFEIGARNQAISLVLDCHGDLVRERPHGYLTPRHRATSGLHLSILFLGFVRWSALASLASVSWG